MSRTTIWGSDRLGCPSGQPFFFKEAAVKEVWKPVVGYEGLYEVSSLGRVRSLDRKVFAGGNRVRTQKGAIKSQIAHCKNRYLAVNIWKDGRQNLRTVHSLVCEAFHGPRPPGLHAAHDDGNGQNNRADNLVWKTRSQNMLDKNRHGTAYYGTRHHAAKLTPKKIIRARNLYEKGKTQKQIAVMLGVSRRTIGNVLNGRVWAHV